MAARKSGCEGARHRGFAYLGRTVYRPEVPVAATRGGFDTRSTGRWIVSHLRAHPLLAIGSVALQVSTWAFFGLTPVLIGRVAGQIVEGAAAATLLATCLILMAAYLGDSLSSLGSSLCALTLAHRLERDARDELYLSLLGKSQTFHNRQRVGDLVSRTTDDTRTLNNMIHPGILFMSSMVLGFASPLVYIASVDPRMLVVPLLYVAAFVVAVRRYVRRLSPVLSEQRAQAGRVSSTLEESISGIEVVKAAAREVFEQQKFRAGALLFRNLFVRQGRIEGLYIPMLIFGAAEALGILHAVALLRAGELQLPQVVALVGLLHLLQIPTFMSAFSFSLVQQGIAGARRIVDVLTSTVDIDEADGHHVGSIRGAICLSGVSFGYTPDRLVLHDIDLDLAAGETVAIVGQTGSGKTTLTQLLNRTYDATRGTISIDGVDLRSWELSDLRSQIASIEQDVFLFSRSIAENIAFARPGASQAQIEAAATTAAAHPFILELAEGYATEIGERGVTLSGGQRQRLALARAFLKDSRILILDDSTSAIDSATEDEIQSALRQIQRGRTTLIITHRLSQIRWADRIVLLDAGKVVGCGSHDELLSTSRAYRRIFGRYDIELPALRERR